MKLSVTVTRLAQVTENFELAACQHDVDMPDELVPKYVMNIFVDPEMIFALLGLDRPETEWMLFRPRRTHLRSFPNAPD